MKKQADIIWLAIVFMAQPGLVFGENERMEMKATGQIGAPNNTLHPLGKKQQRIDKAQGSLSMRE